MTRELVEIQPTELKFIFELKKQSSCSVQLINTSDQYVAYKVKTTNPKRYCVRPNVGVIYPNSPCEIIVTMQAPRSIPSDMQCRDKFLIQSTVVKERTTTEQISSDLFVKEHGRIIEQKKLKVTFISPPNSPAWQPTEDIIKHEALHKADSPAPQSSNTVKVQEAVYGAPSPIKQPLDIVTGKEIGYEAPSPVSQFFDSAKEQEFLHEAVSPVSQLVDSVKRQEFVYQTRSPVLRPIDKEKPAFEALKPRDQVHSFTESSSPKLSQTVVKEVDGLKAKLNEAEKMIARLREETNATTQERDALRHQLMLTNRKRKAQIPVGYPFYFVFFTALVALVVGYMLHP